MSLVRPLTADETDRPAQSGVCRQCTTATALGDGRRDAIRKSPGLMHANVTRCGARVQVAVPFSSCEGV